MGLFFAEEGNRNGISVSEKEYKDAVYKEAMNYPGKEQDFIKFLDKNPSAKEQISAPIFENKVFGINLTKYLRGIVVCNILFFQINIQDNELFNWKDIFLEKYLLHCFNHH